MVKYGSNNPMWKGGKITLVCKECGIEYKVRRSHINRSHFCSRKCLSLWRSKNLSGINSSSWKGGKEFLNCKECGIEYQSQSYEIGRSHFCSRKCLSLWQSKNQIGKDHPNWRGGGIILNCKECGIEYNVSNTRKDKSNFCSKKCLAIWLSKHQTGENASRWDGGITELHKLIRGCAKYKEWIKQVFERDNYKDVITGLRSQNLNAHHINPFSELLKTYNIKSLEDANNCKELWDINNGITLDRDNHMKLFHSSKNINTK